MTDNINEINANLKRAETSIKAAKDMIEKEYYDIAASRAYYAAFYAASALLLKENIDTNKHSGVIASIHLSVRSFSRRILRSGSQAGIDFNRKV